MKEFNPLVQHVLMSLMVVLEEEQTVENIHY
jgi:hypothetical protein